MILSVLLAHWFCDFVLQTDEMAKNKSTSTKWLLSHIFVYSVPLLLLFGPTFAIINGLAHLVVDYITSRVTSSLYKAGDIHNFFVVVGFDQLIHTAFLILTIPYIGGGLLA